MNIQHEGQSRRFVFFVCALLSITGCEGCMQRPPVESVQTHPYPTCTGRTEELIQGQLRSGKTSRDKDIRESYSLSKRYHPDGRVCVFALRTRQEWSLSVTESEVLFDEKFKPIRAWKQMSIPGDGTASGDTRIYELRNDPPTLTWNNEDGETTHRQFRKTPPVMAVMGPGRGIVLAWIKQTGGMNVGDTARAQMLDFRRPVERIERVAMRRDPDREVAGLGTVEVYTVYGREPVFVKDGRVVGDLAGLRPPKAKLEMTFAGDPKAAL